MSAAVVSTSVIGSDATTIHRRPGVACTSSVISSRNAREFAKISGASNRYITRPGSCSPFGYCRTSWNPGKPSTLPSRVWYGHHARRKTLRIDSTTAMTMPGSTPSKATPRNAATDSVNSVRRCFQRRTVAGMSASETDAAMTTAAKVGCGRFRSRPGATSRRRRIASAPTTPVT